MVRLDKVSGRVVNNKECVHGINFSKILEKVGHTNWNTGQSRTQFFIYPVSLTCLDLRPVEVQKVS